MRHVTDGELDKLKPSEKYEWVVVTFRWHRAYGTYTTPDLKDHRESPIMFQCLRCKAHYLMEECQNCGETTFCPRLEGVFCIRCERGLTEWNCSECDTINPYTKTLFILEKKGGCFIATAIYGSYDSPEVRLLRLFRDTVLVQNASGRWLLRTYYSASPAIARILDRHRGLRQLVRLALVQPVVRMVRRILERKERR